MDLPVQAILFLGIIPALFFLYIALKGYEGYYKDKTIFLTFIFGIVFGVLAALIRLMINAPPLVIANVVFYSRYTFIYIILLAFLEQLLKTIVLNIGRLQYKKETVIYGLTLGLGFGASFTPFLVITGSISGGSSISFTSLVAFGSLGFILFHAASGVIIGYGIYAGKMMKYLLIAILLQLPFNVLADLTRVYIQPYFSIYQMAVVIYGAILFVYVLKKIMPQILKEDKENKPSEEIS